VDEGAAMIVASTIVPVLTVTPWARRCSVTASNRAWPSPCASSRWRNLQTVVSSGTGSRPRSMPTNARIVGESYSASSTAGAERLNQCWRKYIRSMRSRPTGGRPFPGFGYSGSMRAHSSRHGTTRSISARNCALRVTFVYCSNPAPASVGCARVIVTSRSRVRLLVASQHNSRESERLIQRFLNMTRQKTDALVVGTDPFLLGQRDQLVRLAVRRAIPTIFFSREFVDAGGLMSYGPSIANGYRQAGVYTGRILSGAKPAELPVLQPTSFVFGINLKTARRSA